jgi:tripartite-type tricarboxylate transporter receptor subunit TctC
MAQAQVRQALEISGNEPASMAPAEFDRFIRAEIPRWTAVIQRAKIAQE